MISGDSVQIICLVSALGFVILFAIVAVGGGLLQSHRFAQLSARLEQQSLERGWHYEFRKEGYTTTHRLTGRTNSVSWQIESYSEYTQKTNQSLTRHTLWQADSVTLPGEAVIVLFISNMRKSFWPLDPDRSRTEITTGLAQPMLPMVLRNLVTFYLRCAPDDTKVLDTVRQVQAGSDALHQHCVVLATSEAAASCFLDDDTEPRLLELASEKWNDTQKLRVMAIIYWYKGIQIIAQEQIVEIDEIEQLIQLGLALVSGQKPSAWS